MTIRDIPGIDESREVNLFDASHVGAFRGRAKNAVSSVFLVIDRHASIIRDPEINLGVWLALLKPAAEPRDFDTYEVTRVTSTSWRIHTEPGATVEPATLPSTINSASRSN